MVTLNGRTAPPEGGFVTATQTLTFPIVSVVVYVVELNPTAITKKNTLINHSFMQALRGTHTIVIIKNS